MFYKQSCFIVQLLNSFLKQIKRNTFYSQISKKKVYVSQYLHHYHYGDMTYIETRTYHITGTLFAPPPLHYVMRSSCLPSFVSNRSQNIIKFIHTMHKLYSSFDFENV